MYDVDKSQLQTMKKYVKKEFLQNLSILLSTSHLNLKLSIIASIRHITHVCTLKRVLKNDNCAI